MYVECINCGAGDDGSFDPLFLADNGDTVCKVCGATAVTAEEAKLALSIVDEWQLPERK